MLNHHYLIHKSFICHYIIFIFEQNYYCGRKDVINIKNLKIAVFSCVVAALTSGAAAVNLEASSLPDSIFVTGTREASIASKPYIDLVCTDEAVADTAVSVDSTYPVAALLFGLVPLKTIEVTRTGTEYVELSGQPVGIMLYSDGLVIAGLSPVDTRNGFVNPGEECGLRPGDVINSINGKKACCADDILTAVDNSEGRPLDLSVTRCGKEKKTVQLKPVFSESDGMWHAGLWIKESSSGLGMLTFVTSDSSFGGLGHAICDNETGALVQIYGGDLMSAELTGVTPGSKGLPGELIGSLGQSRLGTVAVNCDSGVYGQYLAPTDDMTVARVAMKQELQEGKAKMLTTLPGDDKPCLYDVMIEQINYDASAPTRNLIIRVTDPRVIERTGGIVQGMSGSPVIQNGAFVAALTHVFVNDPSMGYGIFAENMIRFTNDKENSTTIAA